MMEGGLGAISSIMNLGAAVMLPIVMAILALFFRIKASKALKAGLLVGIGSMFFNYPEDEICYSLGDQYFFGEDILFAPIVKRGQTKREVYLPQGEWIDVNEGRTYSGPGFVEMEAGLDKFIAFVKAGSDSLSIFQR